MLSANDHTPAVMFPNSPNLGLPCSCLGLSALVSDVIHDLVDDSLRSHEQVRLHRVATALKRYIVSNEPRYRSRSYERDAYLGQVDGRPPAGGKFLPVACGTSPRRPLGVVVREVGRGEVRAGQAERHLIPRRGMPVPGVAGAGLLDVLLVLFREYDLRKGHCSRG